MILTGTFALLGTVLATLAAGYALTALLAVIVSSSRPRHKPLQRPPVTVLKPLCGAEPELGECLRSLLRQDYPELQVVCGVRDPHDPAVALVETLRREFPERELSLVVDQRQHGTSAKVSNLINMYAHARHDYLVIADSDVLVPPQYLERVVSPLLEPGVGLVTCPYHGRPSGGPWSGLGAAFIDQWFMPSVRVAALFGSRAFAFGATIALTRGTLQAIGGLAAIADQLADDYRLGELTRARGLSTVLSDVIVETVVTEPTLGHLARHELRWLRTIRAVRPMSYAGLFVTFALPVAALGWLLAGGQVPVRSLLLVTVLARTMLYFAVGRPGVPRAGLWAVPVGDTLGLGLWFWGFAGRHVHWRQTRYAIARDGSAHPIS